MRTRILLLSALWLWLWLAGQAAAQQAVQLAKENPAVATTMQNAATANGNGTSLDVRGFPTSTLNITASVGMSGGTTINFEKSVDDTTWVSAWCLLEGSNTIAVSTTATGDFTCQHPNYKSVRARISAYSAGTMTVKGYPSTLPVNLPVFNANLISSAFTQTISGTVTANAGTNLNTSALALEAGGNLATVKTNTDPLVTSGGGGYVRQDSTATIAKETGGNLASVAGATGATGAAVPSRASYDGVIAATALPTAATAGNLTGSIADKYGRSVTLPITIRDLTGTQTTTISASTSETTIVTAAASVFNDLVMLVISNTSGTTNTRIDFRDTTGGSVLFSLFSIGGAPPIGFALPVPIPQTSVNTNWTAQCATSTTDVRIYAVYAKNR